MVSGPPRGILLAAGVLIAATITFAAIEGRSRRAGDVDLVRDAASVERALRFVDRADGGVDIVDARDDRSIGRVDPGEGGFVRGALRALVRERRLRGIDDAAPFHLARTGSGRVVLDDPATGQRVDLAAFGPTNAAAFAALLPPERR